jgi:hypothetical protein
MTMTAPTPQITLRDARRLVGQDVTVCRGEARHLASVGGPREHVLMPYRDGDRCGRRIARRIEPFAAAAAITVFSIAIK